MGAAVVWLFSVPFVVAVGVVVVSFEGVVVFPPVTGVAVVAGSIGDIVVFPLVTSVAVVVVSFVAGATVVAGVVKFVVGAVVLVFEVVSVAVIQRAHYGSY